MRIVGGKFRSREIDFPKDANITRPTKDRVREGMFNALTPFCDGAKTLDLFAGSGSLGLEAISRGASSITFVDKSKEAIQIISSNCKKLGVQASICKEEYRSFLEKSHDEAFDLILLDPPYAFSNWEELEEILWKYNILSPKGILVIETEVPTLDNFKQTYEKKKEYHYGRTIVTILWRKL